MRRADYWMCCWPGLRLLWREGQPIGLLWALAFSGLLNAAIISTFIWPEIFVSNVIGSLWLIAALSWAGFAWYQFRMAKRDDDVAIPHRTSEDALFIQAQAEYLKGNWEEAEWLLRQRLSTSQRDIESRLLLLTMYRRRGHRAKALEQLQILRRFDGSQIWREEIERESSWLDSSSAASRIQIDADETAESPHDSTGPPQPRMIDANRVRRAA